MSEEKKASPQPKGQRGIRLLACILFAIAAVGATVYIVSIINETRGIYNNEDNRFK